jgi:hypothetical protein
VSKPPEFYAVFGSERIFQKISLEEIDPKNSFLGTRIFWKNFSSGLPFLRAFKKMFLQK